MIRQIFLLCFLAYPYTIVPMMQRIAPLEKKELTIVNKGDGPLQIQARTLLSPLIIKRGNTAAITHPGKSIIHLQKLEDNEENILMYADIEDETKRITINDEPDLCICCCFWSRTSIILDE